MLTKIALLFLCVLLPSPLTTGDEAADFAYNGFHGSNVSLNGVATITPDGLLMLTNRSERQIGRAFYPAPLQFKNATSGNAISFSTTFIFAIVPDVPGGLSGQGIAFVISPSKELPGAMASQFLGLFNRTNDGNSSNRVVAVELDTIVNEDLSDIEENHVGININSVISNKSSPAAYSVGNANKSINLGSGKPIQIWIEYNGEEMQLTVTLAPFEVPKPDIPLLTVTLNLSEFILDSSYVGFSSSTATLLTTHYLLGWSFKTNGQARALDHLHLPTLPPSGSKAKSKALTIGLPVIVTFFVLLIILSIILIRRKIKFAEVLEDWEREYGPHRFSFRDLFVATNGFKEKELLGFGGFGQVYRGVLKASQTQVAVKRISHESRQGIREFVAEIVSLGRLRHRNLVRLLGYCRRKGELLLVYDFMPNGSLDKFLFDHPKSMLNWSQRFHILKGVASGLLYLHEEWDQVVVHRDIKASNVMLDSELNGKLGDFGLARVYDHGSNPETTHVAGTMGYIAPELTRTGRASTSTDVFAFGAFMLEVACGRRPIDTRASPEEMVLLDLVWNCWRRGAILEAADPKLGNEYAVEEVELVMKLGLLCSNQIALARPSMRQVMQFLEAILAAFEIICQDSIIDRDCCVDLAFLKDSSANLFVCSYSLFEAVLRL
ncbi:hypothetical protein AAC387_Pa03g2383 [Persea americana]